ncbi:acyltransferase family protein [Larkinella bovis]|uniref:Acyltransferase family protein n=1 Tax=Larkinella bovis TaxID=683041 RepID=A0ABW0IDB8_9BACT
MFLRPVNALPQNFVSIQTLRAAAALLVTLFHLSMKMEQVGIHSPILRCFNAGFGGVDLFFIISGFLITHTSLSKINTPNQFFAYVRKRLMRIYSFYWLCFLLATAGLFTLHVFTPSLAWLPFRFESVAILKAMLLLPTHEGILPVTWTLSHEIYFYSLFGLLILSRFLLVIPLLILTATLSVSLAPLTEFSGFPRLPFQDFLFSPFNLEFGFGILSYFIVQRFIIPMPRLLAGLAVVLFFWMGQRIHSSEIGFRVWGLGLPATVILLSLIQFEKTGRFRCSPWLLKLGDASYVLYLIHVPVIMVVTQALVRLNLPAYVLPANLGLLIGLFWFSGQIHRHVEKPLLTWCNTLSLNRFGIKGTLIARSGGAFGSENRPVYTK